MTNDCQLPLSETEKLVKKYDLQGAILVAITKDGTIEYHTWGADKAKCNILGQWMNQWFRQAFTAVPFQTHFGWGNAGKPKPLTKEETDSLTDKGRAWAEQWLSDDFIV